MRFTPLYTALLLLAPVGAHAAALDRSGQSTAAFFQDGNYAEISWSNLSPEVAGRDSSGNAVTEMAKDYTMLAAAVKMQLSPEASIALLYDEPFGAKAEYQGMNDFNAKGGSYAFNPQVVIPNAALGIVGSTRVNVSSENVTVLFGYKPMPALTLLAGGAVQSIEGNIDLRGKAYSLLSGYSADVKQDYGFGYVLGAAFEKPDIALRAALTYRSEVEHEAETLETIALPKAAFAALGGVNNNLAQVNGGLAQVNGGLAQVNAGLQQDPNNATLLAKQAELQAQQTDLQGKQTALLGAQQQFTALSNALPKVALIPM